MLRSVAHVDEGVGNSITVIRQFTASVELRVKLRPIAKNFDRSEEFITGEETLTTKDIKVGKQKM